MSNRAIILFNGPPEIDKIGPGESGLNEPFFNEIKDIGSTRSRHWKDVIHKLVYCHYDDGLVPTNLAIGKELGISYYTVMRAKEILEDRGIIKRLNLNGLHSFNPDLLVIKNDRGKVVKPKPRRR